MTEPIETIEDLMKALTPQFEEPKDQHESIRKDVAAINGDIQFIEDTIKQAAEAEKKRKRT